MSGWAQRDAERQEDYYAWVASETKNMQAEIDRLKVRIEELEEELEDALRDAAGEMR